MLDNYKGRLGGWIDLACDKMKGFNINDNEIMGMKKLLMACMIGTSFITCFTLCIMILFNIASILHWISSYSYLETEICT
eukprot:UN07224